MEELSAEALRLRCLELAIQVAGSDALPVAATFVAFVSGGPAPIAPGTTLLGKVEEYLAKSGLNESMFGMRAIGDPNLVQQMREGRELREKTKARVISFIESNPVHG